MHVIPTLLFLIRIVSVEVQEASGKLALLHSEGHLS